MFGKTILHKLRECLFENNEDFQKSGGSFIPKNARIKHVVTV